MVIPDILRYFRGSLKVRVQGLKIESFFNMSVAYGISFWNVERISMTEAQFNISIKGYKLLKKVLRKTGCQVSIIDKYGFPFFMLKLKRRKMLGIGFAIFLTIVIGMSSFVWSVKIIGARGISIKEIEKNLSELGVKPGAFKLSLPVADIENNMLIRMEGLSWIKVKLVGTRAEVEVKERVVMPEIVPDDKPCDVIAKRDGIIIKIVSSKGDPVVKQGDTVRKGQVLVTGTIKRPDLEDRYVHAAAESLARTWYEQSCAIPFQSVEKIRTGRKLSKIYIKIGSKKIQIKNCNISYKSYDKIEKSTKLIDTASFQLPLDIIIEEYHETANKIRTITAEEAKIEASNKVEKSIMENIPSDAKIINKKVNVSIKENAAYAVGLIETIEDIGIQQEIIINGEV
jgi:similar to stage IV sporulation protein